VGLAADFETHPELRCPKCRARRLVVGADFEYLVGPYRCLQCPWNGTELEQVGHCLRCGCRFPGRHGTVLELRGFHANRLDLLALLPAPRSTLGNAGGAAPDGHPALRPEQDLPVSVGLPT